MLTIMFIAYQIAQATLGVAAGYVHASFMESWCHDNMQHASRVERDSYKNIPALQTLIERCWQSHTLMHHSMSYRQDHVTQFSSPDEQQKLGNYANEHGFDLRENFGLSVHGLSTMQFLGPFLPASLLFTVLTPPTIAVPFAMMSCASLAHSKYVHPYLHKPYKEALAEAPLPIAAYLKTNRGKKMWVDHFVHHRHPKFNFNLLGRIGDKLRGVFREPDTHDIIEIKRIGGPPLDNI